MVSTLRERVGTQSDKRERKKKTTHLKNLFETQNGILSFRISAGVES